jgi:D-aspartate ligase
MGTAFDTSTPALVLKFGRYRLHHGGLALVRSLGRAGVPVYGVHEDRRTPSARSRHLTGGFEWPIGGSASPGAILRGLAAIAARIDRPCVVVPTDDDAAVFLDDHRAQFPGQLLVPRGRPGLARALADKGSCAQLAARAGLPVPAQTVLRCPVPDAVVADLGVPAVVKRARRGLRADGTRSFSTVVVHSREPLRAMLQERSAEAYDVVVQQLFPGDDWLYHGYYDARSEPRASFTGRKLRSRPAHAGPACYARAEQHQELRERVEGFLKRIGYAGAVSMDLRYDRREGDFKLLDVNPRIGACFRVFVNPHGIDVARALHLDLTGREVPSGPAREGRTWLVEGYDLSVRRSYGLGGTAAWLPWLLRADELAWLQRDDLVPPAAAALQLLLGQPRARTDHGDAPVTPRYFPGRRAPARCHP